VTRPLARQCRVHVGWRGDYCNKAGTDGREQCRNIRHLVRKPTCPLVLSPVPLIVKQTVLYSM